MRVAFSIMDVDEKETRLDPRFVKIVTSVHIKEADGSKAERLVGHHPCTEADWDQFAEPDETAVTLFN